MSPTDVKTLGDLNNIGKLVLHFWAEWSEPCKHMDTVFQQLATEFSSKGVQFKRVEAEGLDDVTSLFEVSSVPTFVFLRDGKLVDKLEGADVPLLTQKTTGFASSIDPSPPIHGNGTQASSTPPGSTPDVSGRIKFILTSNPIVLFMKGTADAPRCGFSAQVLEALNKIEASVHCVDILMDDALRQGVKAYSDWPTYPQLFVKGELVGGCDIINEMSTTGALQQFLIDKIGPAYRKAAAKVAESKEELIARIKRLTESDAVMLFMKGSPEAPKCGFSRKVVDALRGVEAKFGSFDILSDEAVRTGLKEYSSWPTYPQLYVKGELVGGCDIILEMQSSGELKKLMEDKLGPNFNHASLAPVSTAMAAVYTPATTAVVSEASLPNETKEQLMSRIKGLVEAQPVMLFMKGDPEAPKCGFSRKVADALKVNEIPFGSFDILSDEAIRTGLKEYSSWPTYPQLYVKGELLGGCDIILEMQAAGQLKLSVDEMLGK
ncbi:hypothetical protein CEUSTIGMA_g11890.t1 [Chlamydomonas eustigma]|uniref:Thioredoxin domain-containing protein n=1 Tax=Chlamydomonas eustigma TaxID=1157962 RepID=A0A250XNU9_9CHLO|nr:hypothetical protein CEUSTIGMA_g11890.t1 [Chlamydomonas eustigma]|eukprot:GAX84470.1 hypothetical protein CEUSTIGMA_g11890.t1 [Chlamydomonas eustigma]